MATLNSLVRQNETAFYSQVFQVVGTVTVQFLSLCLKDPPLLLLESFPCGEQSPSPAAML